MRNSAATLLIGALLAGVVLAQQPAPQYREAKAGYRYSFPRDHFSHPDFKTEWWYYTGNVKSSDGRTFGFQLTFFRQAVQRGAAHDSPWAIEDLYLAHAALSDLSGGKFYHAERLNRAGPGIAGSSQETGRIWNGNWQAAWMGERQKLDVVAGEWAVYLTLKPQKPPVIHGQQGISRKGAAAGEASHYISFTRLTAMGAIELGGQSFTVEGTAWMDHEFFTSQLSPEQAGWDWLSVQLDDQTELMLFRLRRKDGSIDPFSAGTYVDRSGGSRHISSREFTMAPLGQQWASEATGASYPIRWQVSVPSLNLNLDVSTRLPQQEMTARAPASPNYWEGAIEITGTRTNVPVTGAGYLEMTGYDRPIRLGQ
jgi:predicted secreted hydrolase